MANEFELYRDALVVENYTVWPDHYEGFTVDQRRDIEAQLHAHPQEAAELNYERMHTGFQRVIIVTDDDLQRLGVG